MPDSPPRRQLRYGEFLGAVRVTQRRISYNDSHDYSKRLSRPPRLRLVDVHRLLTPYVGSRFIEQMHAVVPLALLLVLFQVAALQGVITGGEQIAFGVLAVVIGLALFMDGVKYGLMSFAENIGYGLPNRSGAGMVLGFAFALGVIATFAEPAIAALKAASGMVDATRAPYLALMLGTHSDRLFWAVAIGVGLAVVAGMLRFIFAWRMKTLVIVTLLPCLVVSIYAGLDPQLGQLLALAWDCGAITTGPVTVPLVLALGIGVAAAAGQQDNPLAGFGIITLASLFPVLTVLGVGADLVGELPDPAVVAAVVAPRTLEPAWWQRPPVIDLIAALRAIMPLVIMLWLVQRLVLGETVKNRNLVAYGIIVAVLGMALFNLGLHTGLIPLGDQAGAKVPAAFAEIDGESALYPRGIGIAVALIFSAVIGYGATIAEPALAAIGVTVERLTDGAFPRRFLMQSVAVGVALGVALGVAKFIFDLSFLWLILGMYGLALLSTFASTEEYVALAWDAAGVTTGEVTVPLVLALGLGLGKVTGAADGFGILALASVGPIITVLVTGIWIRRRTARHQREEDQQ